MRRRGTACEKAKCTLDVQEDGYAKGQYFGESSTGMLVNSIFFFPTA